MFAGLIYVEETAIGDRITVSVCHSCLSNRLLHKSRAHLVLYDPNDSSVVVVALGREEVGRACRYHRYRVVDAANC